MGQRQPTSPHNEPITFQQVEQSIRTIFDDLQTKYNPQTISSPIQLILRNLSDNIPAQKTQQGFVLNHKMIEIFYHKGFMFSMGKMINLLIDQLEDVFQRKTLLMVNKEEWTFCLNVANFIIFFTDDKLIRMIETVGVRSDLSQSTKKFIVQIQNQGNQFSASQSLIDKLSFSEIQRIEKCLRISINQMINMRTQVITRSTQTLKIIQKLQQACFILYIKALYSPEHSQSILAKAKRPEFLKSNLLIAHYFLGKGSDLGIASVYESAVLLLFNLIQKNNNLREIKSLPTHLFKTLPIVSQNTIYDFVMNICLYSLTYIKENNNFYSRFAFNRLMTLKLLDLIVREIKVTSSQITYYLEEVCLQTRIGMIERSFVTDLVQNYLNLVKQTLELNKSQRQKPSLSSSARVKPSQQPQQQLRYCRQSHVSQILSKYLESGKQTYNIKFSNKKWKITTVDIITELQNDENIIQTEFRILCQKYIYEVVLAKKVIYQYNDRQIWSEILPHIIEDKCDSSGDEDGGNYHEEIKNEEVRNPVERQVQKQQVQKQVQKQYASKQPIQESQAKPHVQQSPLNNQNEQPQQQQDQEQQKFQDAMQHQFEQQQQGNDQKDK